MKPVNNYINGKQLLTGIIATIIGAMVVDYIREQRQKNKAKA